MPHIERLQQLIAWLAGTDIGLLDLRTPTGSIRLGRAAASGEVVELDADDMQPDAAVVAAPSVGVFLHAHPMQSKPLASVGDQVSAGQPVGLLQIGPLLRSVDAPLAGVIAEVRADNGQTVGWGEPLLALQTIE